MCNVKNVFGERKVEPQIGIVVNANSFFTGFKIEQKRKYIRRQIAIESTEMNINKIVEDWFRQLVPFSRAKVQLDHAEENSIIKKIIFVLQKYLALYQFQLVSEI